MGKISKDARREIIDDYVKEIANAKVVAKPPKKAVIDFRRDREDGVERAVWNVPIELLRYRKDNGRIASDVISFEKDREPLKEDDEESQKVLSGFLFNKDPELTKDLEKSVEHSGQKEPAIITCDGFLINGNRRRLVFDLLLQKNHNREKYGYMKVVILPGKGEPGGPPTIKEIEQIENKYQLQKEGKAEYSKFDAALSMRRKEEIGMSLEEQLRDDPRYTGLSEKEFNKEVQKHRDEYLGPLDCIDRYLDILNRPGLYDSIGTDREGRWQAFLDYYNNVYKQLISDKKRLDLNVNEEEIGKVDDVAFKLIRYREFPDMKVHVLMRKLPKLLRDNSSKAELLELVEIDQELDEKEKVDDKGNEFDFKTIDKLWGKKNGTAINRQVKKALYSQEHQQEMETPITLLESAVKKLNHQEMHTDSVHIEDIPKAMKLAKEIQLRAGEIESEFFHHQKNTKKLKDKYKK